ncbi:MAG: zinc-binding dehydrogenase [Balneolaceae bacterium]|nr:zinc-binding dehydrogenase [Balneolaceae bacterium]
MSTQAKAVIFTAPEAPLNLEQVELPPLQNGEVLVQNTFSSICKSDVNTYLGKRKEKTPTILGHETIGVVVDVPKERIDDVFGRQVQKGDRITWGIFASDPSDPMSSKGIPQKAASLFKYGHEQITPTSHLHGGFATHTIVRKHTPIAVLEDQVPDAVASIINCSVCTVAGSLRLAESLAGKRVGVIGAGMLGCVAVAMAKASGAVEIHVMDIADERLKTAQSFGATHLHDVSALDENPQQKGSLAKSLDVVLEYSGVASSMEWGLDLLDVGGTAVWVGGTFPQRAVELDSEQVIRKCLTFKGLHNYNVEDFKAGVRFITEHYHEFPFEDHVFDAGNLDRMTEAFDLASSSRYLRVGVRPS